MVERHKRQMADREAWKNYDNKMMRNFKRALDEEKITEKDYLKVKEIFDDTKDITDKAERDKNKNEGMQVKEMYGYD